MRTGKIDQSPPVGETLRRYLTIYSALWKNSVVREMGFKENFILWIVVEMLWFILQLSYINVMYLHTDRIGEWTKWEVILLVGTGHFIQQFFSAIFFLNLTQLSGSVRTGKLDFMLLLPINTRFLISFRQVDLGGFVNAGSALAVMTYSARQLHLHPTAGQLCAFAGTCLAAILLHYSLMLILATTSFWTVRAQGIIGGYYNMFNISRWPDTAFRGFFRLFFTFALPMLLVTNVPAKTIVTRFSSLSDTMILLGLAGAWFAVSEIVWRFSLRRYASASS